MLGHKKSHSNHYLGNKGFSGNFIGKKSEPKQGDNIIGQPKNDNSENINNSWNNEYTQNMPFKKYTR